MAETNKSTLEQAGKKIGETARDIGHRVVEGVSRAANWVEDETGLGGPKEGADAGVGAIRAHMDVIASCGKKIGVVDGVEGATIKLTRKDSPDGQHHFIPVAWVAHVDRHVHLTKNSTEMEQSWRIDPADMTVCGCA